MQAPPTDDSLEYVGFWLRVWACVVDTALLLAVTAPLAYFFLGASSTLGPSIDDTRPTALLLNWVLPALAVLVFWRVRSATPGKIAIRATIVDASTGGPPSAGQLVGRYAGYYLSAMPLCLGLLWVGIDRRKQGWHDKLAGTVVVRRRQVDAARFGRSAGQRRG